MTSKAFEKLAENRQYAYRDRGEALNALSQDADASLWSGADADGGPLFIVAPGRHKAVEAVVATLLPTFGKVPTVTIAQWLLDERRKGATNGD